MENVFFKPWIGLDYESNGIFGKRILALGDSQYCGEECEGCGTKECEEMQTTEIVNNYLANHSGGWSRTLRKFERILAGEETDNEQSKKIWHSIAFYNFVQVAMSRPRVSPSDEDYTAGEIPFFEVLETLRPNLVIAWGKTRFYDNMPARHWKAGKTIDYDGLSLPTGYYLLADGNKVRIIFINHPSTAISPMKMHEAIRAEL